MGLVAVGPAEAGGIQEWALHVGSFNATKPPASAEAGFEVRFPTRWTRISAVAGAAGTKDGSFWAYGGARYDLELRKGLWFIPGFAISLYEPGDGKDLGGAVEFRSSFELAVRTGERSRLGFVFYHLSNAGFYDLNPGSNSAILAWSFAPRSGG